jgi:hypothetical protein
VRHRFPSFLLFLADDLRSSSTSFCLIVAYLVCSAIPVFSGLVGLVAALVSSPLSLQLPVRFSFFPLRP